MNTVDHHVERVLGPPRKNNFGTWTLDVVANAWGRSSNHQLYFATEELAAAVKPGYVFQA